MEREKLTRVIKWVLGTGIFLMLANGLACPRATHDDRMKVEVAVVAIIRTIHTAETEYYSTLGQYTGSLQQLAAAGMIGPELATGKHLGYNFVIEGTKDGYKVRAWLLVSGVAGPRTFYSDQTMTVHEHQGPEPASARDPEMK